MNELDIFSEALELTEPRARQDFLEQACAGQPELRQRIEGLLKNSAQASQFLETPPSAVGPTVDQPPSEAIGTRIGPYKLLQQIGEGGMGTVFMAEQTQPVQRRVALKIIKAGMDSKQVIARFEAERQALAMMDHPNIAKVLDAGATENGRPYFVMELVKGIPITKYCDEKKFGVRERLELFLPACHAVQHAHQKGIIHRDIKPSNVLVALYDGRPVPKIIDFGVAKATASKLTEKTMFTEYGQIIGTLEYMSPEQAELNQLDIDTRTDIYSLGVLLYELLTGTTPIDRGRLKSAAFVELLRIIREEEPPKPSTRLSTCATLASIAANRSAEPSKLSGVVRGDLDWIVMKALDKERSRRYENSTALAQDIERFLNQEAVLARPHSIAYKARKFVRRNRAAVFSATAIAVALLIGTIASSTMAIQFWRQQLQTAAALQELDDEQKKTLEANQAVSQLAQRESQAKEEERKQRELAEQERDKSNRLNDELREQQETQRRTVYIAQMNLIQKAWDSNNLDRVRELLNATRPGPDESDLRGPEWHFWQRKIHPEESAVALPEKLFDEFDEYAPRSQTRFSADARWLVVVRDATTDVPQIAIVDSASGDVVFETTLPIGPPPFAKTTVSDPEEWRPLTTPVLVDDNRVAVEIVYGKTLGRWQSSGDKLPDMVSKLMVIDKQNGEMTFELSSRKHPRDPRQTPFAFSRDGKRVAVAMEEPFVQILDMETGMQLHKISIPVAPDSPRVAEAIALDHQGLRIAIRPLQSTRSGQEELPLPIRIVDVATGSEVATSGVVATHLEFFSDDSRLFAYATSGRFTGRGEVFGDKHVAIFDAANGNRMGLYSIQRSADGTPVDPEPFVLSADGKWLALKRWARGKHGLGDGPQWLEIMNAATGQVEQTIKGFSGPISSMTFNRDSNRLLTVVDAGIMTWPLFDFLELDPVATGEELVNTGLIKYSADGTMIASVSSESRAEPKQDDELRIWNTASGRELLSLRTPAWINLNALAFANNRRWIAMALPADQQGIEPIGDRPEYATVSIWDVESSERPRPLEPSLVIPWDSHLEFEQGGQRLLIMPRASRVGGFGAPRAVNFSVQCYDVLTGKTVWEKAADGYDCKTTDDKSLILSIVEDQQGIHLVAWRTEDGHEMLRIPSPIDYVISKASVSSDHRLLLVACDREACVIDTVAGNVLQVLSQPEGQILEVAISPDGNRIITSFGDAVVSSTLSGAPRNFWPKGIKIWDTRTGMDLLTLSIPPRRQPEWNRPYALNLSEQSIRVGHKLEFNVEPLSDKSNANELTKAADLILFSASPSTADQNRAILFLEEALRLSPGSVHAASLLAIASLRIEDSRGALKALLSQNDLSTRFSDTESSEYFTLTALAQHYAGERDKALESIQQAHVTASRDEPLWLKLIAEVKRELAIPLAQDVPDKWLGHSCMPRQFYSYHAKLPLRVVEVQGDRLSFGNDFVSSSEVVRMQDAAAYYTSAIQASSKSTRAEYLNMLGIVHRHLGEFDRAIEDYSQAISLNQDPAYFNNRGNVLAYEKEQWDMALADYRRAIAYVFQVREAYTSMAMVLRWQGELDQAMSRVNENMRYDSFGACRCERAYIHAAQGELDLMRADFAEAIRSNPKESDVWRKRAWLQATSPNAAHRNGQQAIEDATKACELTHWMDEESLDCLAAAYAEASDFAEAIRQQEKAIELCPVGRRPKFEARLELYKQSKAFREPLIKVVSSGSGM
jgi:serine/threonine protein kinase/tetratricopeptide (TPR) repeat protein